MYDPNSIYNGYMQSSYYNPLDRRALRRALSPYNLQMNQAKPGMTDDQLRSMATQAVLKRYRTQKTLLG